MVNTVMDFIDRLKARVKKENITDTKYLQEVIVDELFIIYVSGESLSDKININTAAKEELMTLSGIGASKAESILKYRQEHGNFQSIEDLKKIEGIKDGVFNKIKDDITV